MNAAAAARRAQPLWSLVPVSARARYIRRAAVATLDELDDLARGLAEATGRTPEQIVRYELLPAADGLRALADDGPRALADVRVRRRGLRVVQAPVGVVGLRGPSGSPWAEPALETGAALLAGNGVLLGIPAQRLRSVFLRAGVPGELIGITGAFDGARTIDLPRPGRRGTFLVLEGADEDKVVEAIRDADWRMGRVVTVAGGLAARLPAFGPVDGDDPRFGSPPEDGLVVAEVADAEAAIALVAREAADAPVAIWAGDPAEAERIAARLPSPATSIGHHGPVPTPVDVRLARHVEPRVVRSRGAWTRRLPVDAQAALAEVRYGRESRRWPALRELARSARRER